MQVRILKRVREVVCTGGGGPNSLRHRELTIIAKLIDHRDRRQLTMMSNPYTFLRDIYCKNLRFIGTRAAA